MFYLFDAKLVGTKNLDYFLKIRVSRLEKERIKFLADKFAGGNMSLWITYCALNAPRKKIKPEEIEETKRKAPALRGQLSKEG